MKRNHLRDLSTDELWALHQEVTALLAEKIVLEKGVLEDRLRQLNQLEDLKPRSTKLNTAKSGSTKPGSAKPPNEKPARRAYPTVLPKYQNSAEPHETWSGRGKQPRWLIAQLRSGKHLEDFRIDSVRVESGSAPSEVGHIELRLASVR
jgi:DNA-binding protein H-NS